MKNDGFTLVELLAVVTIISIITVIAVPSALIFQNNMSKKMFCSKIETVESAAKIYGNDVKDSIENEKLFTGDGDPSNCSSLTSNPCKRITIKTLLDKGYVKREADNTRFIDENGDGKPDDYYYTEFYDPRDFTSMLNDYVLVYVESNRVYTRFVYKNIDDLSLCNPEDQTDPDKDLYYKNEGGIVKK